MQGGARRRLRDRPEAARLLGLREKRTDLHKKYDNPKLEFFPDGTVDAADSDRETSRTRLGIGAVPSLEEINQDPQFEASAITGEAFEALWLEHARPAKQ